MDGNDVLYSSNYFRGGTQGRHEHFPVIKYN
jgi:hypothetical protein